MAAESHTPTPPAANRSAQGAPLVSETRAKGPEDSHTQPSLLDKGKQKLMGLAKKKDGSAQEKQDSRSVPGPAATLAPSPPLSPPLADGRPSPRGSPRLYPAGAGASPSRRVNRSSSPGLLHSPASSQIFERNVQDSVSELDRSELSPHLPTHIQTEDHIPAVLEASSKAITDDHLNPDEVEIVMHAAHQPVASAVAGSRDSVLLPSQEDISVLATPPSQTEGNDAASNYGSIDTTDVRRLSFISFADVVQAEHDETDRDAVQIMSLSSTANRSPSPIRSPTSSHGFSASPPTSGAASEKGADYTLPRGHKGPISPTTGVHGTHSPPTAGGELHVETMRQALRKTGSGDLSGARSPSLPLSPVDNVGDQALSK